MQEVNREGSAAYRGQTLANHPPQEHHFTTEDLLEQPPLLGVGLRGGNHMIQMDWEQL